MSHAVRTGGVLTSGTRRGLTAGDFDTANTAFERLRKLAAWDDEAQRGQLQDDILDALTLPQMRTVVMLAIGLGGAK